MLFLDKTIPLEGLDLDIYKYICAHLEQIPTMKIRDLANETHVSTTSIIRFTHKFECTGYAEFKYRIRSYLEKTNPISSLDTNIDQLQMFFSNFKKADYLDQIDQAIEYILSSHFILFAGTGSSGITAKYAANIFSTLVCFSLYIDDPANTALTQFHEGFEDNVCIIIFSVSGEQESLVNMVNNKNVRSSHIISITSQPFSSLAKLSDITINYYFPSEFYGDNNITSQIPAIAIVEYLAKKTHLQKEKMKLDEAPAI